MKKMRDIWVNDGWDPEPVDVNAAAFSQLLDCAKNILPGITNEDISEIALRSKNRVNEVLGELETERSCQMDRVEVDLLCNFVRDLYWGEVLEDDAMIEIDKDSFWKKYDSLYTQYHFTMQEIQKITGIDKQYFYYASKISLSAWQTIQRVYHSVRKGELISERVPNNEHIQALFRRVRLDHESDLLDREIATEIGSCVHTIRGIAKGSFHRVKRSEVEGVLRILKRIPVAEDVDMIEVELMPEDMPNNEHIQALFRRVRNEPDLLDREIAAEIGSSVHRIKSIANGSFNIVKRSEVEGVLRILERIPFAEDVDMIEIEKGYVALVLRWLYDAGATLYSVQCATELRRVHLENLRTGTRVNSGHLGRLERFASTRLENFEGVVYQG